MYENEWYNKLISNLNRLVYLTKGLDLGFCQLFCILFSQERPSYYQIIINMALRFGCPINCIRIHYQRLHGEKKTEDKICTVYPEAFDHLRQLFSRAQMPYYINKYRSWTVPTWKNIIQPGNRTACLKIKRTSSGKCLCIIRNRTHLTKELTEIRVLFFT